MTEGSGKNAIETQRKGNLGAERDESGKALGRGSVRADALSNENQVFLSFMDPKGFSLILPLLFSQDLERKSNPCPMGGT